MGIIAISLSFLLTNARAGFVELYDRNNNHYVIDLNPQYIEISEFKLLVESLLTEWENDGLSENIYDLHSYVSHKNGKYCSIHGGLACSTFAAPVLCSLVFNNNYQYLYAPKWIPQSYCHNNIDINYSEIDPYQAIDPNLLYPFAQQWYGREIAGYFGLEAYKKYSTLRDFLTLKDEIDFGVYFFDLRNEKAKLARYYIKQYPSGKINRDTPCCGHTGFLCIDYGMMDSYHFSSSTKGLDKR